MSLGKNIELLKERRSLTYEQIGESVGTSGSNISLLAKRNSKVSTFAPSLARYFDVPLDALTSVDLSKMSDEEIQALNVTYRATVKAASKRVVVDDTQRLAKIATIFFEADTEGRQSLYESALEAARSSNEAKDRRSTAKV